MSLTRAEAAEVIYQQWQDLWLDEDDEALTPTAFDDEPFNADDEALTAWVRVAIRHTGSEQATCGPEGARSFDRLGSVFVQVFTLAGKGRNDDDEGELASDTLADTAKDIFEAKRLTGGVVFLVADVREGGVDGRWAMTTVEVPFRYRETK